MAPCVDSDALSLSLSSPSHPHTRAASAVPTCRRAEGPFNSAGGQDGQGWDKPAVECKIPLSLNDAKHARVGDGEGGEGRVLMRSHEVCEPRAGSI